MNIQIENKEEYINEFLIENDAHPLSSIEWGNVRQLEGHKVFRLVYKKNNEILIYAQLIAHRLPLLPFFVAEVWRGPIFKKDADISMEIVEEFFSELKVFCKSNKIIFVKIEPQIEEGSMLGELLYNCTLLRKGEPTNASATARIDLTKEIGDLNAQIDKYTRKNIRRSETRGVQINIIKERNAQIEAIDTLHELLKVTSSRSNFRVREKEFFISLINQQDTKFKIYIIEATIEKKVISSYFVIVYGDGIFTPYSGSRRDLNEFKGNELINWSIIKLGKELNLKYYDQWGILKASAGKTDSLQGVTNFKLSFGGKRIEYIGALDLVVLHTLYALFSIVWDLRKKIMTLKG